MQRLLSNTVNLLLGMLLTNSISEAFDFPREASSSRNEVCHAIDAPTSESTILKIKHHYQGQVKVVVLQKVFDTTLAGPFVPAWDIGGNGELSDEYKLYNNHLLRPTFYHGVNDFSALTYFPTTQTLHGIIDQKFYIEDLPLRDINNPDVVDTFIKAIPDELKHPSNTRYKRGMDEKRKSSKSPESSPAKKSKEDDQKKILYPEIFLIVDVPSTRIDATHPNKYRRALMYVLSYWNAIDMLFRNLKHVDVKLSIAGILMTERVNLEASGLVNSEDMRMNNTHAFMLKVESLESMGAYFYRSNIIKRDSYDFLIWMTSTILLDPGVWNNANEDLRSIEKVYTGIGAPADCGGMHDDESRNYKISNRAVVMYDNEYAQYHIATRGLAQLMFVHTDDVVVSHGDHNSNCLSSDPLSPSSGIMDPSNKRMEGHLLWGYCSEIHFERHARSRSSCCLLNYPSRTMGWLRSTYPVTVETQCECYGMQAYDIVADDHNICKEPLKCRNKIGQDIAVGMPLDGTPCTPTGEQYRSFCYHHECP